MTVDLDTPREIKQEYAHGHDRPLGSYAAIDAVYITLLTILGTAIARRGRLPERFDARDLALAGVATHKLSRLLSKHPVTSPLRAPFTRFSGTAGPAELQEEVRGTGPRHAIGELVSCPFCLAQWVATGFVFGLAAAPRATRLVAAILATTTAADLLHFAHARVGS